MREGWLWDPNIGAGGGGGTGNSSLKLEDPPPLEAEGPLFVIFSQFLAFLHTFVPLFH